MSRAERRCWIAGSAGLLLAALGWALEPQAFPHAWLAAVAAWSGWPLGSVGLLLIHPLTGGRWGEALRPALRLGATTLALLPLAMLPVILTLPRLYPWVRPEVAEHLHNRFYLNVPFFAGRGVFYLLVWFGLAGAALRGRGPGRVAPPGLVLLAFTVTFAAIDLTLSLDPEFRSSIYGMLACAGAGLLALSVAVMLAGASVDRAVLPDLGKLMLALVVLWAYLDFMQLLIVWESDLVSEAPWYAVRMHGFWGWVLAAVALGHFLLPFALLIFPRLQRSRAALVGLAGLLVATSVLRAWWTVLPAVPRGLGWLDVACVLALGGLAAGLGLRLRDHPPFARELKQHV